jgi:hypothetical protein
MNRQSSLRAAAASTAAVLETDAGANSQIMNAPEQTGSSPAIRKPIGVDLASPNAPPYWGDRVVEMFTWLEELYPGDPGQCSGVTLRISESGRYAQIRADVGDASQLCNGLPMLHCLGYLDTDGVARLAEEATAGAGFVMALRELYPYIRPDAFSGATLVFFGGDEPKIQLYFGAHCLGVLRGRLLAAFLECARLRSAAPASTEREVE